MKTEVVIAFPEKHLQGKNLVGLQVTRLRVNHEICIGVPISHLKEICEILGMATNQISQVKTDFQGVYLAKFNQNGKAKMNKENEGKEQHAILRRKYMELCGYNRKAAQLKALRSAVAKLQSNIEQCQKQLVASLRKLEEKQLGLQAVQGTDESSLSHFGDEFDQLLKHPDIEKFEITGNKIVAYTKPIAINYHKVNYDIGRFKITIHADGSNGGLTMVNQTRVLEGHHHPHIDYDGKPCLGNIKEVIPHMIAEHKYAAVVAVCIQYLKSYENSDSYHPYCDIENWPRKKGSKRNENN